MRSVLNRKGSLSSWLYKTECEVQELRHVRISPCTSFLPLQAAVDLYALLFFPDRAMALRSCLVDLGPINSLVGFVAPVFGQCIF